MTLVHQIGNFEPPYSTENELKNALQSLGVFVVPFQENDARAFDAVAPSGQRPDLILWTHTQFPNLDHKAQYRMLGRARIQNIPVIGYHLDRWWGLSREHLLDEEPFFRVDTLYTADGGDHDWQGRGIHHRWSPPGVDRESCVKGTPRDELRSKIAFVGSWQGHYHNEHGHRAALVKFLTEEYGDAVRFFPEVGRPAVRGTGLQDLYASVDVVVGDSCFTGTDHYWSDRIPETLGRGGFLIHPEIEGLSEYFVLGTELVTWRPFDWEHLKFKIDWALDVFPEVRNTIADNGQARVLHEHTYAHRMAQILTNHGLSYTIKESVGV